MQLAEEWPMSMMYCSTQWARLLVCGLQKSCERCRIEQKLGGNNPPPQFCRSILCTPLRGERQATQENVAKM